MKDTFSDTCINVFLIFMSNDDKYSAFNIKLQTTELAFKF